MRSNDSSMLADSIGRTVIRRKECTELPCYIGANVSIDAISAAT
jgi:hypothetical protein